MSTTKSEIESPIVSLDSNIKESPERESSRNSMSSSVSVGSFQEAPTLLEAWDIEFDKNYKGKHAGELIMSEMMGVNLDSMQHNAIQKLIRDNKFDPRVWKASNEGDKFPSDCNKDVTFKHCIYMGLYDDVPVYLDQWENFFDKEMVQYDVVGEPNESGLYEFKEHEPIPLVDTTSAQQQGEEEQDSSVNSNKIESISSESGASKSLLEKWKEEQTNNYDENSKKKATSDIMGIELTKKQHEVIGDLIEKKIFHLMCGNDKIG